MFVGGLMRGKVEGNWVVTGNDETWPVENLSVAVACAARLWLVASGYALVISRGARGTGFYGTATDVEL